MSQPQDPHSAGYGEQPSGPQPTYGQPGSVPPPGYYAPDHPKATTSLVLGILGVVLCQVIAPFAWVIGRSTVAEIDASGGRWGGRGTANTGYILGIVGTAILGFAVLFLVGYLILMLVLFGGMAASSY